MVAVEAAVPLTEALTAVVPLSEVTGELDTLATPVALSIPVEL